MRRGPERDQRRAAPNCAEGFEDPQNAVQSAKCPVAVRRVFTVCSLFAHLLSTCHSLVAHYLFTCLPLLFACPCILGIIRGRALDHVRGASDAVMMPMDRVPTPQTTHTQCDPPLPSTHAARGGGLGSPPRHHRAPPEPVSGPKEEDADHRRDTTGAPPWPRCGPTVAPPWPITGPMERDTDPLQAPPPPPR